MYQELMVHA